MVRLGWLKTTCKLYTRHGVEINKKDRKSLFSACALSLEPVVALDAVVACLVSDPLRDIWIIILASRLASEVAEMRNKKPTRLQFSTQLLHLPGGWTSEYMQNLLRQSSLASFWVIM